jgi:hypothetical protein
MNTSTRVPEETIAYHVAAISDALTSLGKCHESLRESITIGGLARVLERHGFSLNGTDFLVGENCEDTDKMTTLISEGVIFTKLKFAKSDPDDDPIELSIHADLTGLYISSVDCPGEFHFETFCPSWRLYSLEDIANVDEGFFSCGNNGISCGPRTTALLQEIYSLYGAEYDEFNGKDVTPFLNHRDLASQIV